MNNKSFQVTISFEWSVLSIKVQALDEESAKAGALAIMRLDPCYTDGIFGSLIEVSAVEVVKEVV